MPADYEKIREENIARYGWDTAVLDLLGQLYSERTHFIFELIQNAEDAGATELAFELFADRLELRHDGRPFTEADVRGVCGVGKSAKSGDLTAIGKFGIGFKSVYAYTRSPRVHSGDEHFGIENYVRPFPVEPLALPSAGTLFVFPFDHDTVPAAVAAREIAAALTAIQPRILLFLRSIGRLRVGGHGGAGARSSSGRSPSAGAGRARPAAGHAVQGRQARPRSGWPGTARPLEEAPPVEIAFRVEGARPRWCRVESSPLIVSFPTEKETFLGFLVQGPYRTTPARDNVPGHDPSNQLLVRETAALLCDVLRQLRDEGLLTVDVLTALPLDAARFPAGSMFRPLFDAVGEVLATEPLIPVAGGGYGVAVDLEPSGGTGVRELLAPGQLGALCGADRPDPVRRMSPSPSTSPRCCGTTCGTRSASTRSRPRRWCRGSPASSSRRSRTSGSRASTRSSPPLGPVARRPGPRRSSGSKTAARSCRPTTRAARSVYLPGPGACQQPAHGAAGDRGRTGRPAVPRGAEPDRTGRDRRGAPDHPAQVRRLLGGPGAASTRPGTPPTSSASCGRWTRRRPGGGRSCWSGCGRLPS